jgi:heme/copper-type cytochrome/quinol oxidase subunit 2
MLAGIIFKSQHWLGANIAIVLGCCLLPLAYGIPLFIEKNKSAENSFQKFFNIWVLILTFISIPFMFKFQHWDGAGIMLIVSEILLVVSIPIFIIRAVKAKDSLKNLNFHNEAILFIFITASPIYIWISSISKEVLTSFVPAGNTVLTEMKYHEAKSNELYNTLESAVGNNAAGKNYLTKAITVKTSCDSLNAFILSIENLIITGAGQKSGNPDSLQTIYISGNLSISGKVMITEKKGEALKAKINEFKTLIDQNTNSRGKDIIGLLFNTDDPKPENDRPLTWESVKFEHLPMISALLTLNQLRSDVRLLEAETMIYLQTMAAQAINHEDKK